MDKDKVRELELELEVLRTYASREQRENAIQLARERWYTEFMTGKPWQVVEAEDRERRQWEERCKLRDELVPVALGFSDPWDRRKRLDAWERLLRVSDDYRPGYLDYCREINAKPRV